MSEGEEDRMVGLLKRTHADGARYGFRTALAIVQGYLDAWSKPEVIAAVSPEEAAARRDQIERVLNDLLEQEKKL